MAVKIIKQEEEFSDAIAEAVTSIDLNQLALRNNQVTRPVSFSEITLAAISKTISDGTVVDHAIYDTSTDSDGGLWRKRCQSLSWYKEPLNTATRGATREFPAKALIVAESAKVTIYDATKPSLPMWMVKTGANNSQLHTNTTSISMKGSVIAIGDGTVGLYIWDFNVADVHYYNNFGKYVSSLPLASDVQTGSLNIVSSGGIANISVNDVAITYLDDAPVVNGVRVPTIWAGTQGGLSVIKDDGTVVSEITRSQVTSLSAIASNRIIAHTATTNWRNTFYTLESDGSITIDSESGPFVNTFLPPITSYNAMYQDVVSAGVTSVIVRGGSVAVCVENKANPLASLAAYIDLVSNTGYMVGDIQTCVVGGAVAATDRSVKALAIPGFTSGTFTSNTSRYWFKDTANIVVTLGATVANGQLEWWELVSGVAHHYIADVDGAGATLTTGFVDGIAGTPSTNVTVSGGTTLTILANVDVDTVRASATAKTAEQVTHTFTTEHPTFTGAACLLTGSNSVTELTYHERQDIYGVVNGTKKDYFKGLQLVDSVMTVVDPTIVTGITLPVIDLVKSGTSNTYVAPAIDVNAELNDMHQTLAKARQKPVMLDFNLVAQSKFLADDGSWTKGAGWTIANGVATAVTTNNPLGGQSIIKSGITYVIVYTVVAYTQGSSMIQVSNVNGTQRFAVGTYTEAITPTVNGNLSIYGQNLFSGSIDNVFVRESTDKLPRGFKPQKVYVDGIVQTEGVHDDYTVTFDNFIYGIQFAVEPAGHVQVEGVYA